MQRYILPLLMATLVSGCGKRAEPQDGVSQREPHARHVVLVTIDGLMPEAYMQPEAHGLDVPNLRRFVREGAFSDGALSVFPSVTYPSHTSIATGVNPARHGIYSNRAFDPLEKNLDGWQWYAEDIQATPIWELARIAGLRTALISWPVTVGAKADWLVPEIWRAKNAEDLKLVRALSTPGLLEAVNRHFPDFWARFVPSNLQDQGGVDVACHLIGNAKPNLLMLHIAQVDGSQHRHGIWSAQALAAIENADRQLGRLLDAVEHAGIRASTAIVVASDHGFARVSRLVHPGVLLREKGLVEIDDAGHVAAWRAAALMGGGLAYIYVRDETDTAARETVKALFTEKSKQHGSGIARVLSPEEVSALGGDRRAALAIEAEAGAYFGGGYQTWETVPPYVGMHGYAPQQAEMKASLLMLGPWVKPGVLSGARLIDVAPTIAAWFGLNLPSPDGKPLASEARANR